MKIFDSTTIPHKYKRSAIAIGNFDGVHKGHQKVFQKTKKFSKVSRWCTCRLEAKMGTRLQLKKITACWCPF